MSFLSVLQTIGHVIGVGAQVASPFLPTTGVFGTIMMGIAIAEQLISSANSGSQKKQMALAVINNVHPGLDQAKLSSSVDSIVSIINQLTEHAANVPTPVVK